ncbi:phosphoenolpyruvate--protein phosphotransferase [Tissierella pigra]|uniref:Phosphoenolpyruvate-protein phosphotransferase n=1 Tax=Tissierella pigra TaxID=2607614 RepID=A0A6N7XYP1_9FIRM|nr:phosphoenolpyruvate--protein phosphotransferase [Tissierella pigra]MBU5425534.1 phosphoenolpyruvate--protein phosphotransferase [Tissierella pigra]MSU00910.1 phosphoenolpyruvate--protein phosphotransferase [Tissierella pigra]
MEGLGTSVGIGIGKVLIYKEPKMDIVKENILDLELEMSRLENALKKAIKEIEHIYNTTLTTVGEKEAEIFTAHKMILEDPEYIGSIKEKIRTENINSEWAIKEVTNFYIEIFNNIEDEYIKERVQDIKDVSNRILKILLNIEAKDLTSITEKTIIVAHDLTPSDTAQINKEMVVGIVTEIGGRTSHTSIMARTMNIPAISGVENIINMVEDNDVMIVDGSTGDILVNPIDEDIIIYESKQKEFIELRKRLEEMKGKESISKDGYKVEIAGNIGTLEDIDKVIENDGEGVGLYRTEFLYMYRDRLPTEEEQFEAYKVVAEKLGQKPLVIRTLDVGGDKEIPYLNIPKEMNPFLGYRAIRYCLENAEIFRTQLRAILRASAYGNIKIMFPMISDIKEVREGKKIIKGVMEELRKENILFNENIEIGIMVEIPAVAVHSRVFAKEVDFFSIGTNDLIQYSLAVDRGNQHISHLYNQFHPAVLSLIKMTIDNGHKEGIWVGMCGEVAGDEKLIPLLLAMGLDEFSMNSSSILKARHLIRNISKEEMESILDEILSLPTAEDVEKFIDENIMINILPI